MDRKAGSADPKTIASEIDAQIRALQMKNTKSVREVLRPYSRRLRDASAGFVLRLAQTLVREYGYRSVPYELIEKHRDAFQSLGQAELEMLGQGIDSWSSVDSFARTLSGPAWLKGQITDGVIHEWAASPDRWWRRAALVSTVALNVRSTGGYGDAPRTLAVCRILADDADDMVVKAMSWALRELVPHDPEAVRSFLAEYDAVLAARVKREVENKLTTGLKNPRRR